MHNFVDLLLFIYGIKILNFAVLLVLYKYTCHVYEYIILFFIIGISLESLRVEFTMSLPKVK
jgi:hypothetical protein